MNQTSLWNFSLAAFTTSWSTSYCAFLEQLSREEEAQAMCVGLKYSVNNRLWLTVDTILY